jgi:hypothetical protein
MNNSGRHYSSGRKMKSFEPVLAVIAALIQIYDLSGLLVCAPEDMALNPAIIRYFTPLNSAKEIWTLRSGCAAGESSARLMLTRLGTALCFRFNDQLVVLLKRMMCRLSRVCRCDTQTEGWRHRRVCH